MLKRLTPQTSQIIGLLGFTPDAFLGLCIYIVIKQGWKIEDIGTNYIEGYKKGPFLSWGEFITIEVKDVLVEVRSHCHRIIQFLNIAEGKENIDSFITEYEELRDNVKMEVLEARFAKAKTEWNK